MKSRRVILTIEVETNLPTADLRRLEMVQFLPRDGWSYDIYNLEGTDQGERIVQVQVNAIKPEPQPRSQRARMAKFAKDDAERADPKRPGWFPDRIAEVQNKPERKAKRAKGAK